MIDYYRETRDFWLTDLEAYLKTPALVRIDVNVPVVKGRISENSLRLLIYANVIEVLSEYAGLVVVAHQGRPGGEDFLSLKQHWAVLRKHLPLSVDIEYVPYEKCFRAETRKRIKELKKGEVLLFDNIRMNPEETKFDAEKSMFISFFKGVIRTCINDGMPVWHRRHTSVMSLPYIAPTFIGFRSTYELKVLNDVLREKSENCCILMGGAKFEKASLVLKIAKKMKVLTGGIPGQLIALAKGYDLGKRNNAFLKRKMKLDQFETAKALSKLDVLHPVDFVVSENGEVSTVKIEDMRESNGIIMDIGEETLDKYVSILSGIPIRLRAGPLGVYEQGFLNGVELTKRILGHGLIFIGGDTSQEAFNTNLERKITSTGGALLISGGSFLHGLAGNNYPCLDEILKQKRAPA